MELLCRAHDSTCWLHKHPEFGEVLIKKVVGEKAAACLQQQGRMYEVLGRAVACETIRLPRVFEYSLQGDASLTMSWEQGTTLETWLADRHTGSELATVGRRLGHALRRFHSIGAAAFKDAGLPGKSWNGDSELALISTASLSPECLRRCDLWVPLYRDYTPWNVLVGRGLDVVLLDPPNEAVMGPPQIDLGIAWFGLMLKTLTVGRSIGYYRACRRVFQSLLGGYQAEQARRPRLSRRLWRGIVDYKWDHAKRAPRATWMTNHPALSSAARVVLKSAFVPPGGRPEAQGRG